MRKGKPSEDRHYGLLDRKALVSVATFEAIIKEGQVRLPPGVRLPENTTVYVVVPDMLGADRQVVRLASPRLARPEEAADFTMRVSEADDDAGV